MADNLDIFIAGSWRKDAADFLKAADDIVGKFGEMLKASRSAKIGINFDNKEDFTRNQERAKKSTDDFKKSLEDLIALIKAKHAAEQAAQKTLQEKEKTEQQSIKTLREKSKQLRELKKEQDAVAKAQAKEEVAVKKAQSEHAKLRAEYNKEAEAYKNLAAELERMQIKMGQTYAPGDRAKMEDLRKKVEDSAASTNKLGDALSRINEKINIHTQHVGNYARQWNGVNFSIQQLVREVPSTVSNLSMLPLALSNNIGPLIDSIKQARVANAALAAEGKATIPVWKQVGSAIFSWQTALMAGIAMLISYSSSASTATKKVGDFNEALKANSSDFVEAKTKLEAWKGAIEKGTMSVAAKEAAMEDYNRTLGDQMGKVKDVAGWEKKIVENTEAFLKVLFLRAQATAALAAENELLAEHMKNVANGGKDLLTWRDKAKSFFAQMKTLGTTFSDSLDKKNGMKRLEEDTKKTNAAVDVLQRKWLGFFNKAAEESKKYGFDLDGEKNPKAPKAAKSEDLNNVIVEAQREVNEALKRLREDNLQTKAENDKAIADDEKRSLEERLDYHNAYYEKLYQLEQVAYEKELEDLNLLNEKKKHEIETSTATEKQKNEALTALAESYAASVSALFEKYELKANRRKLKAEKDQKEIVESSTKEQLRVILQGAQDIENQVKESEYRKLELLETAKANGLITQEQYEKQRKEIIANSNNDIAAGQRQYFLNEIDELEKQGKLTKEVAARIRKELSEISTSKTSGGSTGDGLGDKLFASIFGDVDSATAAKAKADFVKYFNEIYSSIKTIIANKYSAEIQGLEKEMDLIKTRYDQEVELINSMSLTKEEREKRLADLKARNTLKELDQQRRINEVKRRQARAEKTANIAETVGKTAIAVMNALSVKPFYLGIALAAAAGIAGAAQIAAISSTPLPEYWKGTDNAKPGFAHVAERGPELVIGANGPEYIEKPSIRLMKGGEQVLTAEQTREALKRSAMGGNVKAMDKVNEWVYYNAMMKTIDSGNRRLEKALDRNRAIVNLHVHDNSYANKRLGHGAV